MIRVTVSRDAGKIVKAVIHIDSIGGDSIKSFQTLLNRALNTWDSAPGELKELGDMFEHGKLLQQYKP